MAPVMDFIDVSHHNGVLPWNRLRDAGVRGAMCKVSDGYFMPPDYRGHIDSQFENNWSAANMFELRGATIFPTFDSNRSGGLTPAKQIKLGIDHVGDHKETDILAIDVEQHPVQIAHISKLARLHMLIDAFAEARKWWDEEFIWNYTGKWWWDEELPRNIPISILQHPLWAAYYGTGFERFGIPRGYVLADVVAHQFSPWGKVAGHTLDRNDFRWDWDSYLKVPVQPPPPPTPPSPPSKPSPAPGTSGCIRELLKLMRPKV